MMNISAKLFSSTKERTLGLITYKKAFPVFLKTRFGIHTLGMKFPIDVLILDNNGLVVKMTENLKPGNIFFWPFKYTKVLELPAGFIRKNKLGLGSKITLKLV